MSERLIRFQVQEEIHWGLLNEDGQIAYVVEGNPFGKHSRTDKSFPFSSIKLLAPVCPEKIVLVGLNYAKHVSHSQSASVAPDEPVIFLKPPTAIIGPEDMIIYPPAVDRVDYEAELGVVIGRTLRNASVDEAREGIFGLTCVNDVTARNLQKKDGQWTRAKGFDTFCPVGPWIVRGVDWSNLGVEAYLNGQLKQSGRTSEMIFKPEVLIAFISKVMTLRPGDLISTGTPEGIDPMHVGDKIEIVVEHVGRLVNYMGE